MNDGFWLEVLKLSGYAVRDRLKGRRADVHVDPEDIAAVVAMEIVKISKREDKRASASEWVGLIHHIAHQKVVDAYKDADRRRIHTKAEDTFSKEPVGFLFDPATQFELEDEQAYWVKLFDIALTDDQRRIWACYRKNRYVPGEPGASKLAGRELNMSQGAIRTAWSRMLGMARWLRFDEFAKRCQWLQETHSQRSFSAIFAYATDDVMLAFAHQEAMHYYCRTHFPPTKDSIAEASYHSREAMRLAQVLGDPSIPACANLLAGAHLVAGLFETYRTAFCRDNKTILDGVIGDVFHSVEAARLYAKVGNKSDALKFLYLVLGQCEDREWLPKNVQLWARQEARDIVGDRGVEMIEERLRKPRSPNP